MKSKIVSLPDSSTPVSAQADESQCPAGTKNHVETEYYDPYQHSDDRVYAIGYVAACVHLIRSALGAGGILLAPFAFSQVGNGVALVAMAVAGALYVYNIHSFLRTDFLLRQKLKVPNLTFVAVVEASFDVGPRRLRSLLPYVKFMLYAYWTVPSANGICLLVMADCSARIIRQCCHHTCTGQNSLWVVFLAMVMLCLIARLKFLLVPVSVLTTILSLGSLIVISVTKLDVRQWPTNGKLATEYANLPQFFAMLLPSLGVTGLVMPLRNEMRNPKVFSAPLGVLNVSFVALSLLVGGFGLVGYSNLGSSVADNILLALPAEKWSSLMVLIFYMLSSCVTYALMFYVYCDTIWENFFAAKLSGSRHENAYKYCLRVAVNVVAYGMAVAVPKFGLFATIVGSVGILIEVGLPSLLRLLVLRIADVKTKAVLKFLIAKNAAIMLLSVIMFAMSMKNCVSKLIELHNTRENG